MEMYRNGELNSLAAMDDREFPPKWEEEYGFLTFGFLLYLSIFASVLLSKGMMGSRRRTFPANRPAWRRRG
jgi:hypothetical protein